MDCVINSRYLPSNININTANAKRFLCTNSTIGKTLGSIQTQIFHGKKFVYNTTAQISSNINEQSMMGIFFLQQLQIQLGYDHMMCTVKGTQRRINYSPKSITKYFCVKKLSLYPDEEGYLTFTTNPRYPLYVKNIGFHNTIDGKLVKIINTSNKIIHFHPDNISARCIDSCAAAQAIEEKESVSDDFQKLLLSPKLSPQDKNKFINILRNYSSIINSKPSSYTGGITMKVKLNDPAPFSARIMKIPLIAKEAYNQWLQTMLSQGILRKSKSKYLSNLLCVAKTTPNEFRFVLNVNRVNALVKLEHFPLPQLHDILKDLAAHKLYVKMDLSKYFDSLPLHKDSQEYFSFCCPISNQIYSFCSIAQGYKNSSFHSQMIIKTQVLQGLSNVSSFIDDCFIFANDIDHLIDIFKIVMDRFKKFNLHIHPNKTEIGLSEVTAFGFKISYGSIQACPKRSAALLEIKMPNDKRSLFQIHGSYNYFRCVIPKFAEISAPIAKMLSSKVKFELNDKIIKSINDLKNTLRENITLSIPHKNPIYILNSDSSTTAYGGTFISQNAENPDDIRLLSVMSGAYSPVQSLYHISQLEILAFFKCVKRLENILIGIHFKAKIDNSTAVFLLKNPENVIVTKATPVTRILLYLQNFSFSVELVSTKDNSHAMSDLLSRSKLYKLAEISAKELLTPSPIDEFNSLQYYPLILSKKQIYDVIKKFYSDPVILKTTKNKFCKYEKYHEIDKIPYLGNRIIVPEEATPLLIHLTHAHGGANAQKQHIINRQLYIQNLEKHLTKYHRKCLKCQRLIIEPIPKQFPSQPLTAQYPFQILSMDHFILNELPGGILIFTDCHTQFIFGQRSSLKADNIATVIMTQLLKYGITGCALHADNFFRSKEISEICKLFQIEIVFSASRNSRSNSQAERAIKKIKFYFQLMNPDLNKLDEVDLAIAMACLLINSQSHENQPLSSLEIVIPSSSYTPFSILNLEPIAHKNVSAYTTYMLRRMNRIYEYMEKDTSTNTNDLHLKPLEVGTFCRIIASNQQIVNKLSPKYNRFLYKIIKRNVQSNTYQLEKIQPAQQGERRQTFIYHRRLLKSVDKPCEDITKFWQAFYQTKNPLEFWNEPKNFIKFKKQNANDNATEAISIKTNSEQKKPNTKETPNSTKSPEIDTRNKYNLRKSKNLNYNNLTKKD